MPQADYVTVDVARDGGPSCQHYGITPRVVLNVFPLAELTGIPRPAARPRGSRQPSYVSMYWFSISLGASCAASKTRFARLRNCRTRRV